MKNEPKDYSAYLAAKNIKPLIIERTKKQKGDIILISDYAKVEVVQ